MLSRPISRRSILMLSSHLCLSLPSGLFPSRFPTKILYAPLLSLIRPTCLVHLILLDFITQKILGEGYRSLSYSLCSFRHSPVTLSLLGPNILLSILFSNTLRLSFFLNHLSAELNPICHLLALLAAHHILHISRIRVNVRDQVLHQYKTTGKIMFLCVFIFKFFDRKLEDKRFCTE